MHGLSPQRINGSSVAIAITGEIRGGRRARRAQVRTYTAFTARVNVLREE